VVSQYPFKKREHEPFSNVHKRPNNRSHKIEEKLNIKPGLKVKIYEQNGEIVIASKSFKENQ
jgi:formylmethanofuran dehydrogenase subunit D